MNWNWTTKPPQVEGLYFYRGDTGLELVDVCNDPIQFVLGNSYPIKTVEGWSNCEWCLIATYDEMKAQEATQ